MKLKIIVGISLFAFLIIVGNIMMLGLIKTSQNNTSAKLFFAYYIIFSLIALALISYFTREEFKEKSDFVFFIVLGVFVAIALSLTVSSFKIYNENLMSLSQMQPSYAAELDTISQNNEYYGQYINYLELSINNLKNDSTKLKETIVKLNASLQPEVIIEEVIVEEPAEEPVQEYIYYYPRNEDDEEEEDDD